MTYKQTVLGAAYRLVDSHSSFTVVSEGGRKRLINKHGIVLDKEMTTWLIGALNRFDKIRAIRFD